MAVRLRRGPLLWTALAAVGVIAGGAAAARLFLHRLDTSATAGEAVFETSCAACHGAGAAGGRAPALDSGRFRHGDTDEALFKTIRDGLPGTEMPPFAALPASDIRRVVSYLRSLAPEEQAGLFAGSGRADRGEALFFGKGECSGCHEIDGRGSVLAADLSGVGAAGSGKIRTALDHGSPGPPGEGPRLVDATLVDGRTVRAAVRAEDSFSLALQTADGSWLTLDRPEMRSIVPAPSGAAAAARLTPGERGDLVAYLARRKGRDLAGALPLARPGPPSGARLEQARGEPHNWMTYWGDYAGRHFTDLTQITPANVGALQSRWAVRLPSERPLEATPLVVDGVIYASGAPGDVYALDARTGLQLWAFHRKQDVVNPSQINPTNRGVAVLDGRVFVTTLDNLLIALDARTGRPLWERRVADTLEGYTMTGAPLALPDRIVVGSGGGEFAVRGFLDAYDPATGKRLWRFDTIPGPGQPGHDTWPGDSWKTGGGGTWLTGSYDPELKLLYWAVGNPAPSFNPEIRKGDNLHTNSVVALDPATGGLRWSYQFTPNDSHDWDSNEALVLTDRLVDGRPRKLLLHADRNGFLYTLDRTDGRFVSARPFVRQTWNDGFDARGRPRIRPGSAASKQGTKVYPAVGGTNFQAPSYDDHTGVLYLPFLDAEAQTTAARPKVRRGRQYLGGWQGATNAPELKGIRALDVASGKALWTFPLLQNSLAAGVLATRGGVVFAGSAEGGVIALDMKTGAPLWRFAAGAQIKASPISYAVGGRQFVAIAAGDTLYSFALPAASRP